MSHAVKRIKADIREMTTNPSDQYVAEPLEDNMFEWHFTLRGPPGTDFDGGVYHGRILLPAEYPMKPPNIVFLTPNGRFQVGKKICLSISAHHPEHWQPAWGIRLILEALISFFPTEGKGAIGSLDWTPRERCELAQRSATWSCPRCGCAAELLPAPHVAADADDVGASGASAELREQLKQLHLHSMPSTDDATPPASPAQGAAAAPQAPPPAPVAASRSTSEAAAAPRPPDAAAPAAAIPPPAAAPARPAVAAPAPLTWSDPLVSAAIVLVIAIAVLLVRKATAA